MQSVIQGPHHQTTVKTGGIPVGRGRAIKSKGNFARRPASFGNWISGRNNRKRRFQHNA
jgi:hypothetical protein